MSRWIPPRGKSIPARGLLNPTLSAAHSARSLLLRLPEQQRCGTHQGAAVSWVT